MGAGREDLQAAATEGYTGRRARHRVARQHGLRQTALRATGRVPVSDRRTLGGLTQFLTQFGFSGSSTSP